MDAGEAVAPAWAEVGDLVAAEAPGQAVVDDQAAACHGLRAVVLRHSADRPDPRARRLAARDGPAEV